MEKLIKVQKELKAPKNQFNKFGNYSYRNQEDILEAVKPLLSEQGLLLTVSDEIVLIGDRYYVKATAKVTDGTNTVESIAYAREEENKKGFDASQLTGSTSSYARKYALNGLFLIDDVKDADNGKNDKQEETVKMITDEQIDILRGLKVDVIKLIANFGVKKIGDLTFEQGEKAIEIKKSKMKKGE